jgi:hypothetical protein
MALAMRPKTDTIQSNTALEWKRRTSRSLNGCPVDRQPNLDHLRIKLCYFGIWTRSARFWTERDERSKGKKLRHGTGCSSFYGASSRQALDRLSKEESRLREYYR